MVSGIGAGEIARGSERPLVAKRKVGGEWGIMNEVREQNLSRTRRNAGRIWGRKILDNIGEGHVNQAEADIGAFDQSAVMRARRKGPNCHSRYWQKPPLGLPARVTPPQRVSHKKLAAQ